MIFVAADHFGFIVKQVAIVWLRSHGFEFEELGSRSESDIQSITDFIPAVTKSVLRNSSNRGIMICGTGIGVDIGANRFRGIRSVLASTPRIAEWSRTYDNSNMLCLSGWEANMTTVESILQVWFNTPFTDDDGSKSKFLSAMDNWK